MDKMNDIVIGAMGKNHARVLAELDHNHLSGIVDVDADANRIRMKNAKYYDEQRQDFVIIPYVNERAKHVYHQYTDPVHPLISEEDKIKVVRVIKKLSGV